MNKNLSVIITLYKTPEKYLKNLNQYKNYKIYIFDQATNKLYMHQINTHPGMTESSFIPEQAEYCGISFLELIKLIMEVARCD